MKKQCKKCKADFETFHNSITLCNFCTAERNRRTQARRLIHKALEFYKNEKIRNNDFIRSVESFVKHYKKGAKND